MTSSHPIGNPDATAGEQLAAQAALRQRPGDQTLPTVNDLPDVQSMVLADLRARRDLGISRYGTALQPHNGRDMLRDLYEELIDAAVYARGVMAERELAPPPAPPIDRDDLAYRIAWELVEGVKRRGGAIVQLFTLTLAHELATAVLDELDVDAALVALGAVRDTVEAWHVGRDNLPPDTVQLLDAITEAAGVAGDIPPASSITPPAVHRVRDVLTATRAAGAHQLHPAIATLLNRIDEAIG